ncbi:MAG: restriction endonuclease PLD domain-containing protein [Candidatus Binataceae bacterium]
MPLKTTVLFDAPQKRIADLIVDRITSSVATSIVTGFATPAGLALIANPIRARPQVLKALVVGAATYSSFKALDSLLAAGVQKSRLRVHLGHSSQMSATNFARYHPMLHSKVYFMEQHNSNACAFIGSHNLTAYALKGLNGEAAIMLEGPSNSLEFDNIRAHINATRTQAIEYSPDMKEELTWWTDEYLKGLREELDLPAQDALSGRTILIFVNAAKNHRPKVGDRLYFEIPSGIAVQTLNAQAHIFLYDNLPQFPREALNRTSTAAASYACGIVGADNRQGNREVVADWEISAKPVPVLRPVPGARFQTNTAPDMQQVRVEVASTRVDPFEYVFKREKVGWDPIFYDDDQSAPTAEHGSTDLVEGGGILIPETENADVRNEVTRGGRVIRWRLVKGFTRRSGITRERDEPRLLLVGPESNSFILVSVGRRRRS